jgi:hypothetical protein
MAADHDIGRDRVASEAGGATTYTLVGGLAALAVLAFVGGWAAFAWL